MPPLLGITVLPEFIQPEGVEALLDNLHSRVPVTSYGPIDDFVARAKSVYSGSKERLWINRYAYLSDEKLDALGRLFY